MPRRCNTLAIAYDDLIDAQERTLATAIRFIQGDAAIDSEALAATLARVPVGGNGGPGGLCDPRQYRLYDVDLYARLERRSPRPAAEAASIFISYKTQSLLLFVDLARACARA